MLEEIMSDECAPHSMVLAVIVIALAALFFGGCASDCGVCCDFGAAKVQSGQ